MTPKNYDVQDIEIHVAPDLAYQFIAEPTNVPKWAIGFSKVNGSTALMETPQGKVEIGLEMKSNPELRTVDTLMTFPDGSVGQAFSRITGNNQDQSAIFTFVLMAPPVPLEQLEGSLAQQKKQLAEELVLLKRILERKYN
ncbi:hypothetical protein [Sediminicola luteus]|uniref:Polyketide cyclase n=1 Tax=Sediminicola luteus TaxID=319238 RepID=A0A2A4GCI1_9FLAO|nr:hypothetical protein [Sediminicola luteus]PCE66317.1 hypothetical protein B7P33_03190 [Sediminicola luteus]